MKSGDAKLLESLKERLRDGKPEEVVKAFEAYLEARPRDVLAWTDLAGLLCGLQRNEEALKACRRALALNPGQVSAQFHLGCVHLSEGRLREAEGLFRRVLAVEPRRMEARLSLANCLLEQNETEAAREELEKVVQQDPSHIGAHQYLGQIFYRQGQWREFWAELERFAAQVPASPYLEFERGFANLLWGDLRTGWQQWEARLRVPGLIAPERHFEEPCWTGEAFVDRTLLVHYEQGFGDTLMLARFLPQVKARGGRVLLLVQPQLADLVTPFPGVDQVIPEGDSLPPFDLQVSLYSLPAVFQTDLETIPAEIPYLGIPRHVPNREKITEALAVSEGHVRIGLAWAGHPGHPRNSERSLPVGLLNQLEVLKDVAWHGFQLGQTEEPGLSSYVSLAPLLSSFSDTAYALSGMDLLVTVDTVLAHLAGAMGIPTLLIVTYVPDYRWMLDREDSPWYPTLRIYRQPRPGDWESVIRDIVRDLGPEGE